MEIYKGILCISGTELIKSDANPIGLMLLNTYMSLKKRRKINVVRRGCNSTPSLIEYDSLPLKYRQAWEALHGDPKDMNKLDKFANRLRPDLDARNVYTDYRYNDNQSLTKEVIDAYCNDAMILNAIKETLEVKTQACMAAKQSIRGSWDKMLELVDKVRPLYANNMPKTTITLKRKYDKYITEGYYSLIHSGYGNRNAIKVEGGLCEATLLGLLEYGNQLPASKVADRYNMWATANGYDHITERTVINYLKKHEFEIGASRYGAKAWADKYDPVIRRFRPTVPLMMVNSDDNDLDLYFRNGKDYYYRFKMYVVLDAYNNYILGYAIGDQITKELIAEAHRDALQHIKELTGNYYLWHQEVADRWGLKGDLLDHFKSLSHFTPPTAGLARAKIIEQSFGTVWHNTLKNYPNYAGHNITATEKHNPDFAQSNKKNRPTIAQGRAQVAQFVEILRTLPNKEGRTRRDVWVENFWANEASRKCYITPEVYLQKLGIQHNYENTIRNDGLTITINEIRYNYDIPAEIYRNAVGQRVRVTYDPTNLSTVLVEGSKLRFIATENNPMPMALGDYSEGDRARLNNLLATKVAMKKQNKEAKERRREINERYGTDAHSLLQAGILNKEGKFKATEIATRIALGDDNINISNLM